MKKKSLSGSLRDRISIERRADVMSGYGEGRPTWSALVTLWAQVRDESQREYTAQFHVQDQKVIKVTVRTPQLDITPKDRVRWLLPSGDRALDIKAVLRNDNETLTMMCVEHSEN